MAISYSIKNAFKVVNCWIVISSNVHSDQKSLHVSFETSHVGRTDRDIFCTNIGYILIERQLYCWFVLMELR